MAVDAQRVSAGDLAQVVQACKEEDSESFNSGWVEGNGDGNLGRTTWSLPSKLPPKRNRLLLNLWLNLRLATCHWPFAGHALHAVRQLGQKSQLLRHHLVTIVSIIRN
ncbi:MAG: hypothetical protein CMJ77_22415 [Planctomycetaceae bacterium]|nr:hypothetical protein [Planctomycetaceae bacterium]